MEKFKLSRTRQCAKCPWKVNTNPHDIPHGYSVKKHEGLSKTIAKPGALNIGMALNVMSCHEAAPEEQAYCIGWLHNQLGTGNNIGLRMAMRGCENIGDIELVGEQHETFNDTLPK